MYIDRILLIVLIRFMKIEIILFTYNTYVHLIFNMLLILLILLTIAHQVQIDDVEVHLAVLEVSLQLNFQFLLQNTALIIGNHANGFQFSGFIRSSS